MVLSATVVQLCHYQRTFGMYRVHQALEPGHDRSVEERQRTRDDPAAAVHSEGFSHNRTGTAFRERTVELEHARSNIAPFRKVGGGGRSHDAITRLVSADSD